MEKRLAKISDCFLNFGTDPLENINRLTALCGEILEATCALYNRLDGGLLYSWGQWNTPTGYHAVDKPDGHICYDVIKKAKDQVVIVSNLPETRYAQTNPNVIPYKLQTYVARAVKFGDACVGSLCVFYQDDFVPSKSDTRFLEIIASAIGVEEKRKQAQVAQRVAEEKYRVLVERANDAISILQEEKTVYRNPVWVKLFGYSLADTADRSFFDFIAQADRERVREYFYKHLRGEIVPDQFDVDILTSYGRRLTMEVKPCVIEYEGKAATMILMRDITERKRAEEQLRCRDAILEALAAATKRFLELPRYEEGIQKMLEELGQATGVSRVYVFENHTGVDGALLTSQRHEWVASTNTSQLENPDTQNFPWFAGGMGRWVEILEKGGAVSGLVKDLPPGEQEILAPQGIQSIVAVPIFVEQDWWGFIGFDECSSERVWSAAEIEALKAAAATLGAIIQRKRMEEALRRSEEFNRVVIENMADRVFAKDLEGRYTILTKVSYDFWGVPYGSALGKTDWDIHSPLTAEVFAASDRVVFESGEPYFGEERAKTRDGRDLVLSVTKAPLKDATGKTTGLVGISRDITDIKRAEEALLKAQEELESRVAQRTAELVQLNRQLRQEIEERKQIERELRKRESELEIKTSELEEVNTALRVLLKRRDEDKKELEDKIQLNVKELVLPYLERLKKAGLVDEQASYLNILESNLNEIVAPFLRSLIARNLKLTPMEIQVASLVKEGKTTKHIAELLNLSGRTVEFHRNNIRKKLGLNKSKVNLRSHLLSI